MATPELAAGQLESSLAAGDSRAAEPARRSGAQVIEFDASRAGFDGDLSYRRTRGFVYDGARAGRALRAGLSQRTAASRPLPMEEVCLYVKEIDNSQLRRQADPSDRRAWMRLVVLGFVAMFLTLATHAPHSLLRQSGYRLEKLHEQYQAMAGINEQLRVRHAMMSDPRRITELAAQNGLTDTPPERFAWQDRTVPPAGEGGEVAQSRRPQD
jgi:hypothetical protein